MTFLRLGGTVASPPYVLKQRDGSVRMPFFDGSLQLEIISAWWDFHDFDKDGEPVSMSGKPSVADTYIWAADVMMEKGTRPPALLETGAVRAHNDQIQNSIAIDNVPIELSDSDSD